MHEAQASLGDSYLAASQARCFCMTAWAEAAATFKSVLKVNPEQEREPGTPDPDLVAQGSQCSFCAGSLGRATPGPQDP